MNGMKRDKVLFTLAVDGYEPDITAITFPLLQRYAGKIGADFHVITERKHPDKPPVYEKFQIYDLIKDMPANWYLFIDADALIHPDLFDVTSVVGKDMTLSYGSDFVPVRFTPDKYFLRDRRWIGKGNWIGVASDWCAADYWHPLDDITFEEAVANIHPTVEESKTGVIRPEHLIDDYIVSRNIARYGLKHMLIPELMAAYPGAAVPFYHEYRVSGEKKVVLLQQKLREWGKGAAGRFLRHASSYAGPRGPHVHGDTPPKSFGREECPRTLRSGDPFIPRLASKIAAASGSVPREESKREPYLAKLYGGWNGKGKAMCSRFASRGAAAMGGPAMTGYIEPNPPIPGWMFDGELDWLYRTAKQMRSVVEVGSWMGKSTHALASGCPGIVIAVDHFKGSESQRDDVHALAKTVDIGEIFARNMAGFTNVILKRMDSLEAAAQAEPSSVDMIFIDGDHEYCSVRADIKAWLPIAGRLLCGHDLREGGVEQALISLGLNYENPVNTIWAVRI